MNRCALVCFAVVVSLLAFGAEKSAQTPGSTTRDSIENDMTANVTAKIRLVIHGGAGTIERAAMTTEAERAHREGLARALKNGYEILKNRGTSLDAVVGVVRTLEDDPLFNAGKGAVFTSAGTNELDASIMDGKTLKAGAVAGVKHIKNPIELARLVMEKSPHVLLAGEGAEAFAKTMGVALVDEKYFFTPERWEALQRAKEKQATSPNDKHGTVGAVALDANGNLAAATSTGGMTNKLPGRVGDTPIIGAGTYANNDSCAVSATGDGEYFIRTTAARDVAAQMEYRYLPLATAAQNVIDRIGKLGGSGGLIALDKNGNMTLPFNSSGMYRGYTDDDGKAVVEIYK